MHVTYINRDKRKGNFSFERIFRAIQGQLMGNIEIENYYLPSVRKRLTGIREVSRLKSDVFHITGDVNFLALGLPPAKTVITVHDLGYFENPVNKGFKRLIYKYLWLKYPLGRASAITTVSEFTKSKLIEHFKIREDKITVIPNPVFLDLNRLDKTFNVAKPVILQIGTGPHKNLIGLIEAVKGLNVKISIVGNPGALERMLLEKYRIDHEVSFHISDSEMIEKYAKADILYFASFYEGFGMPIIEANQIGLPVITSNCASMPWVAGNAAMIVDPGNKQEIRNAIQQIIQNPKLRDKLIHNGFNNVKRFDLTDVSKKYLEVYKRAHYGKN